MKAVQISGKRECELVEVPDPQVRDHYVMIKVHTAPLCTEARLYDAGFPVRDLGHEATGEVVEVGSNACGAAWDRVAQGHLERVSFVFGRSG